MSNRRSTRNPRWMLGSVAAALLLVAGLFMLSVVLPPVSTPAQVLVAPPASAVQAPDGEGENGTLASFTALIPEIAAVHMPLIVR
jgi:hypothetical protein